jgi:hypothetical protein
MITKKTLKIIKTKNSIFKNIKKVYRSPNITSEKQDGNAIEEENLRNYNPIPCLIPYTKHNTD